MNITNMELNNARNSYMFTKDDSSNWQVSDNIGNGYYAEYQISSILNSTIAEMIFSCLAEI